MLQPGDKVAPPWGRHLIPTIDSDLVVNAVVHGNRVKDDSVDHGSQSRRYPGRPRIDHETEQLVVRMAKENSDWGYDRIVGAMVNLGYTLSDQTVGNILQRHDILPAPERQRTTTWADFIRAHLSVIAGTDFLSVEVLTLRGLVTYYVLFFIHLESRKVEVAGITLHPNEQWMK